MITQVISQSIADEVVDMEAAMEHSRLTDAYDEIVIRQNLDAAHSLVEQWLNRKLYVTTVIGVQPTLQQEVFLPFGPIQSIVSVTAEDYNEDDVAVDAACYKLDAVQGLLRFKKSEYYNLSQLSNFNITYTCGYASTDDVPAAIKHAIRMTFASFYEFREDAVTGTQINAVPTKAKNIVRAFRLRSI